MSEELALSKETLDQSAREKAELSSRLDDLQKQVNTLQKLIRLKDEQLAAMEAMLDKQNQLLAGKSVSDDAETEMKQEVQPPVASTSSAATTGQVTAGAIGLDLAAEAEKQSSEAEMPEKQEMASETAMKDEAKAEPKPEPVKSFSLDKQETQELDPGSFLVDSLRKNATIIGGAAAAILALVLLLMIMRRRRKNGDADAKQNNSDDSDMSGLATGAAAGAAGVAALDSISDDDLPDDLTLDDDLSGDLDDDLSGGLDDTELDMDLSLDETPAESAAEELSLDDLGESDALAESSSAEIEDLGDFDLAAHLVRSQLLADGETLTAVTRHLCTQFGIQARLLPMSDQPAPTMIDTDLGLLPFQNWFVKERWQPVVREVRLPEDVRATPQVMHALENADFVIIAPSNPFVSIDPILHVYPIREMIMDLPRAVVAVTPIIGGKAVKGPAAKMMAEMSLPVSAAAVATYYGDLIDGFVIDDQDAAQQSDLSCALLASDTIMRDSDDRARLATEVLRFVRQITD